MAEHEAKELDSDAPECTCGWNPAGTIHAERNSSTAALMVHIALSKLIGK